MQKYLYMPPETMGYELTPTHSYWTTLSFQCSVVASIKPNSATLCGWATPSALLNRLNSPCSCVLWDNRLSPDFSPTADAALTPHLITSHLFSPLLLRFVGGSQPFCHVNRIIFVGLCSKILTGDPPFRSLKQLQHMSNGQAFLLYLARPIPVHI